MSYYVYIYYDPRPGKNLAPIYVGKGHSPKRKYSHLWGASNSILRKLIAKIRSCDLEPIVKVYRCFLAEQDALDCEQRLIVRFGRRCYGTGTLANLADGGGSPMHPNLLENIRRMLAKRNKSIKHRKVVSETRLAEWRDPKFHAVEAARLREMGKTSVPLMHAALKQARSDPERRAVMRENIQIAARQPARRRKLSKAQCAIWAGSDKEQRVTSMLLHRKFNCWVLGERYESIPDAARSLNISTDAVIKQRKLEKAWWPMVLSARGHRRLGDYRDTIDTFNAAAKFYLSLAGVVHHVQ